MVGWELAPISWEAAATLATGFAAVFAAWWVGHRQVEVSNKQAETAGRQSRILERQVHLEELNLRHGLFERRVAIFDATERFLIAILQHADVPEAEVQRTFTTAMMRARFLFKPQVHERLRNLWQDACQFFAVKSAMKSQYESTGDYGAANIDREHALLATFGQLLQHLPDVFGDELKLAAPPP